MCELCFQESNIKHYLILKIPHKNQYNIISIFNLVVQDLHFLGEVIVAFNDVIWKKSFYLFQIFNKKINFHYQNNAFQTRFKNDI